MKDIEKMTDWEILTYLRLERKWMVQSHYIKSDIEDMIGEELEDDDWENFTEYACDAFDNVKEDIMISIIDCAKASGVI